MNKIGRDFTSTVRLILGAILFLALLGGCANDTLHREGIDLVAQDRLEEGVASLQRASLEAPSNVAYRVDYLRERDRAIALWLQAAERDLNAGSREAAATNYQRVLKLDPGNTRAGTGLAAIAMAERHDASVREAGAAVEKGELEAALTRLQPVLVENPGHTAAQQLRRTIEQRMSKAPATLPTLTGKFKKPVTLQFREATLKMVAEALSRASGINIILDKDVKGDTKTTIFVKDASVEDTIDLILMQNQLAKKVLNDNTVFIYPNSPAKLKEYQDLVIRTFHLTNADAKQMLTMLKTLLKTKDIFIHEKTNSLVMRDTPAAIRLAEKLLAAQDINEPEVMLEVEVLEVLRSKLTEIGVKLPNQIGLSVTETAATTSTTIGPGGYPITTTEPAKPLTLESVLHLDGGDIKVTSLSAFIDLRKEVGDSNLLASPRIRVRQREKAKILIGDRVPVITNSVTPVATGAPVVTGTVQYLDVGLKLEVEPEIHMDGEVAIKTFLEVSTIAREVTNATSGTVAFQIGTRNATTVLRLKDGETQVLAGLISDEDRKSATKFPGLGDLPLLGRLFSSHKNDARKTEIILSITPRIIRNNSQPTAEQAEFWSGTEDTLRTQPLTLMPTGLIKASAPEAAGAQRPGRSLASPIPAASPASKPAEGPLVLSWVAPGQAKVGESFKVVINGRAAGLVASTPLVIGFDPTALEVVGVEEGDLLRQGGIKTDFSHDIDASSGQVFVNVNQPGNEGVQGEGKLATVAFKVLADKPETQITLAVSNAAGPDGEPVIVLSPNPLRMVLNP